MQVDTPPPPTSDTKRSRSSTVNAITAQTWIPAGVLVGVVIAALTVHGAWRGTESRNDLQDVALEALRAQAAENARELREVVASKTKQDMALLNLQRDMSEVRASVGRIEEVLSPANGRTVRR